MKTRTTALLFVIAMAATGCSTTQSEPMPTAAENSLAGEIQRHYSALAANDPMYGDYSVAKVTVDDGHVTVQTGLYPDGEGQPFFMGACSQVVLAFGSRLESISVKGSDDARHAYWNTGDDVCVTGGL